MAELLLFPAWHAARYMPAEQVADVRPPDWQERERALDTGASWIVEAPAGSGKTGLLIQRFLKLLADESVTEPEQVLAITFTNKATAELQHRVLAQVEAAARGTPPGNAFDRATRPLAAAVVERDRACAWHLLQRPRRLNIRTIDAVSAEIARALPLLSGSGGRLRPIPESDLLFRDAARRTLQQLGGPDRRLHDALSTVLLHRDGNLTDCEKLIAEMLQWRDQWQTLVPLSDADLDDATLEATVLPRLERALETAICQGLTLLNRAMPASLLEELTATAAEFALIDGYRGEPSPIAHCAGRFESPGERAEHLAHWRAFIHLLVVPSTDTWRVSLNTNYLGFNAEKHHKARLKAMIADLQGNSALLQALCAVGKLPPARYPPEQWIVAKALFHILKRALAELHLLFAERGDCDFAELGLAARAALRNPSGADDLAAALGTRTRHLLVDEMQDTSTSQYELIERLTAGWDGRGRTVFLVGDPKQSIYRFRQARVERFMSTMHHARLGDVPMGVLRLAANFRSGRRLVTQFNDTFSRIFPTAADPMHPEEVRYVQAEAVLDLPGSNMTWHTEAVFPGPSAEATRAIRRAATRVQARSVRELVMDWLGRPLPPGRTEPWRIAVLVRVRGHLIPIVAAFKGDGVEGAVPFRAVEIEELGERQEVLDLLALTRALLHPADRAAWFAVLRAPWCGLGLADLLSLSGSDDPSFRQQCLSDLIAERGHLLSDDGEQRLARVWPILQAAAAQRGRLPLAPWVERTWRSLGGDTYLGPEHQRNCAHFFSLLDELQTAGARIDLSAIERRMKRLYAEPAVHPGAVDLMTIHGAKGLEWDFVIVPALERIAQADKQRLLNWMEVDAGGDQAAHIVLAPIPGRGENSRDLNEWIKSVHNTREAAERKRLLYVAATRARQELHLFAMPDRSAKGEIAPAKTSLLEAAWPAVAPRFHDSFLGSTPPPAVCDAFLGSLAAEAGDSQPEDAQGPAGTAGKPPLLQRLPLAFDPDPGARTPAATRFPYGEAEEAKPRAAFARPEGSFAARAFGNTVHAFLELAANRLAEPGSHPAALRSEASTWLPRATALLRAEGLPPVAVARFAGKVIEALLNTLDTPVGQWILAPHPGAATEYALPGVSGSTGLRLDRIFRAGASPHEPGDTFLWIVDHKTTTHGSAGLDDFLNQERAKYEPQLEAYAQRVAETPHLRTHELNGIRIGLFYPMLSRMIWWSPSLTFNALEPAPEPAAVLT